MKTAHLQQNGIKNTQLINLNFYLDTACTKSFRNIVNCIELVKQRLLHLMNMTVAFVVKGEDFFDTDLVIIRGWLLCTACN
ncbi:hypothetical protein C8R30_1506 [Nitrosomonas nitrosa]|nr:hypothetical protein C8R30_1506 [Nitrosomonas nitrosa]